MNYLSNFNGNKYLSRTDNWIIFWRSKVTAGLQRSYLHRGWGDEVTALWLCSESCQFGSTDEDVVSCAAGASDANERRLSSDTQNPVGFVFVMPSRTVVLIVEAHLGPAAACRSKCN